MISGHEVELDGYFFNKLLKPTNNENIHNKTRHD